MNEFVISGVKMLKPSGEVETANIFVSGDKISKITRGGEVIHDKNLKFFSGCLRMPAFLLPRENFFAKICNEKEFETYKGMKTERRR